MSDIKSYKDLIVWHKAMELVKQTYDIIASFPKEEKYALSDQMRRSVVSIPSNIAEGHERGTAKEYAHFLVIAKGSLAELMTQFEICKMLGYVENLQGIESLVEEISKMLNAILKKLIPKPNP